MRNLSVSLVPELIPGSNSSLHLFCPLAVFKPWTQTYQGSLCNQHCRRKMAWEGSSWWRGRKGWNNAAAQLSLIILNKSTKPKCEECMWSCSDLLWLLLWFLVKSASTCLPSYTNPHQPLSEMSKKKKKLSSCASRAEKDLFSMTSRLSLHRSCKNFIKIRAVKSKQESQVTK